MEARAAPDGAETQARPGGLRSLPLGRWLVVGAVGANVLVAALIAAGLVQTYLTEVEETGTDAQNLAHLVGGQLHVTFDTVDAALQTVADEAQRALLTGGIDTDELERVLDRQRARAPDALSLRLVDARGWARRGSPALAAPVDLSDREFFAALRDDPHAGLKVSGPFMGRIIRKPVMVLSRRLSRADGSFGGLVSGSIELARLSQVLATVDVGALGTVTLRWSDLSLVASHHPLPVSVGSRAVSAELRALVDAGREFGTYEATSGVDGVPRIFAFAKVGRYPLFVVVGLGRDEVLRAWWRELAVLVGVLACFTAGTTAAVVAERRALRRRLAYERLLLEHSERLRESEERFRTAFQTSPDAIILAHVDGGTLVAVNEGFARVTGWSEAEAVGRTLLELGLWDDPAERARLLEELRARGAVSNAEARFVTRAGEEVDALVSGRLLTLRGQPLLLGVARDIRDWKRAEAERERLQAQVQQAQKLESIGQLAGGVAHDFNNLLTVILSCAEVLRDDVVAGRVADPESVEEIASAGARARDLTRQLLTFARKQVTAPECLDLNAVVVQTERLLRRTLREDVAVTVRADPQLWPVWCDPVQMEQVLLNLCVNARDAMPDGGRLTIETRNVAAPPGAPGAGGADLVLLAVEDTGVGMPPEVQAHLFEPFFTTKPPGKGTGMGLATVHGIVTQSGGRIRVESGPGRGTRFEITLPRTRRSERPGVPVRPGMRRGSETVLVVEDDRLVRSVTVRALEEAGYRVLAASQPSEALALARVADGLDLLVTDVVMPGQSGPALAAELRRTIPGLRVLLVSGYAREAIEGGDDGAQFLQKPFTPAALQERVRQLLDEPAA